MTDMLPSPVAVSAFLLTYLLHSTLAVLLTCAILRHCRIGIPDVRLFLWKMTLTVPIATSLAVTTFELPHVGVQWVIADTETLRSKTGEAFPIALEKPAHPTAEPQVQWMAAPFGEAGAQPEHSSGTGRSRAPSSHSAAWLTPLLDQSIWPLVTVTWIVGILIGCAGLCIQLLRLHRCRRSGMVVTDPGMLRTLARLVRKTNVRRPIDLLESSDGVGPLTAGFRRPFILIPRAFLRSLTRPERDALLAHELAHVANRDACWNLIGDSICRFLFFQPLNRFARRQLRIEMEFAADWRAVQMLKRRSGLARCLTRLGEWVNASSQETAVAPSLAAGMASFRSVLGRRVETLLVDKEMKNSTPTMRLTVMTLVIVASFATVAVVPRAAAHVPPQTNSEEGNKPMLRPITVLAMLAGLALPAAADDEKRPQEASSKRTELKTSPDPLPDGIKDFNGMLVGRLAKKDVEKGTFVVRVDAVPRVWRNSKAENPKSIVGKNVEVEGVFGKWLDVLLIVREGETLEFEAKHDGGEQLTFPGELLRKAAPYKAEDYPELPERFRGFRGAVAAEVVKKDPETFELIVKVDRVIDVWKASKAEEPKSIEGKQMMVAGFWQRKDAYHNLKVGDRIEVGLQHIEQRSDHMTVADFIRKTEGSSPASDVRMQRETASPNKIRLNPTEGFRGVLVGRIVSKDVERGTFAVNVDAVPRVWKNNKARAPKDLIGKEVTLGGVSGPMLDVLVVAREGQTIEVGALHDGGEQLRVVELLRTVAPVQPGDYPELPESFRGFRGSVVGTIVKKDPQIFELMVEVDRVKETWPKSRAKEPQGIVGKPVMLTGFWQRKDAFHRLKIGDTVECGMVHEQTRSDHLQVAESVKKLETQATDKKRD